MEKGLTFYYDEEGDILDVAIGEPQPAKSVEIKEDIFLRMNNDTVVGFMVMNFKKRFSTKEHKGFLPIECSFEVPKEV